MAVRLDRFTRAYDASRIPFLAAEILTDGRGEMVDAVCRYANAPATAALGLAAESLKGRRFCRSCTSEHLSALAPAAAVAFGGSSASFVYTTVLGRRLQVTCYQLQYGVVGCILDEPGGPVSAAEDAADARRLMPGGTAVLETGRSGVRGLFFSPGLVELTGWSQREMLNRFSGDLSALICPEDWPELLQGLLDAGRSGQTLTRELRLLCANGAPRWIELRAMRLRTAADGATFCALAQDIDVQYRTRTALDAARQSLDAVGRQVLRLPDALSGGWLYRPARGGAPALLRAGESLAALWGCTAAELTRHLRADPLWHVHPDDRAALQAAARAALETDTPLHCRFRIQRRGAPAVWLQADGVPLTGLEGGALLCGTCADVTASRETERQLEYHSALTELLLSRPGCFTLDYDPQTDTAVFTHLDDGGRRIIRTLNDCSRAILTDELLHPDDRRPVLTAIRQACVRPGRGAFDYQASYVGKPLRRYHLTFLSLAGADGAVCRVIGKGELADSPAERG